VRAGEAKTRKVPYKFRRTMEDREKPRRPTIDLTYLRSNECRDTCWRVRTCLLFHFYCQRSSQYHYRHHDYRSIFFFFSFSVICVCNYHDRSINRSVNRYLSTKSNCWSLGCKVQPITGFSFAQVKIWCDCEEPADCVIRWIYQGWE